MQRALRKARLPEAKVVRSTKYGGQSRKVDPKTAEGWRDSDIINDFGNKVCIKEKGQRWVAKDEGRMGGESRGYMRTEVKDSKRKQSG